MSLYSGASEMTMSVAGRCLASPSNSRKSYSWQRSLDETNIIPQTMVVNPRTGVARKNQYESPPSREIISPMSMTRENLHCFSVHEKLYRSGRTSPTASALFPREKYDLSEVKAPLKCTVGSPRSIGELCQGHEFFRTISPTKEHVRAYKAGVDSVPAPLTIVSTLKRGVKYPKRSSEISPPGISRNANGGFFSRA